MYISLFDSLQLDRSIGRQELQKYVSRAGVDRPCVHLHTLSKETCWKQLEIIADSTFELHWRKSHGQLVGTRLNNRIRMIRLLQGVLTLRGFKRVFPQRKMQSRLGWTMNIHASRDHNGEDDCICHDFSIYVD